MAENSRIFPAGPLDYYRKCASFDWKLLKVFMYGQQYIDFEQKIYDELLKYPELYEYEVETPILDEERRKSSRKMFTTRQMETVKQISNSIQKKVAYRLLYYLESGMAVMARIAFFVFPDCIEYMGTEKHARLAEKARNGEILGCFALTEIAHGSNTKSMRTTATYDVKTKQFILNSPDFEAAKCWSALLGHNASYAIIFAHLTTPDGIKRGLHSFVVPIRNPNTLMPYRGLKIIDMGEKIGQNGNDNGAIMFNNYCIPRDSLLNRFSDVTEEGTYQTVFKDPLKRHGASLANLTDSRIAVSFSNVAFLSKALTIAIRYSAVRKQFGIGNNEEEIPILEYQSHQYRLFPYLGATYCFDVFCNFLFESRELSTNIVGNPSEIAAELHAIISAFKPVSAWIARDGIRECREACGGHGYLKAAGIGTLRNSQDVCCTYEGDGHVLIQQTSNWLLKCWSNILSGQKITTPFKSLDFLNNIDDIAHANFFANSIEELIQPDVMLKIYQWLVYHLLKRYYEKFDQILNTSKNPTIAKNESQVYYAIDLVKNYITHFCLIKMFDKIGESNDSSITKIFSKLMSLYGLWNLQKYIPILYIGGYATDPGSVTLIQETILKLCIDLKDDSVALIDVIAPPDFVMNSVLGHSDGHVYKHLEAVMIQALGALSKPKWWKEILYWKDHVKPKL